MSVTWEYRLEYHDGPAPLDWLNQLGSDGWEVVLAQPRQEERGMVAVSTVGYHWLFKRRVPAVGMEREWVPEERAAALVREAGMRRVEGLVERTRKGWSEEVRARARETRERNRRKAVEAQEAWDAAQEPAAGG